jgi:hypothetical protein
MCIGEHFCHNAIARLEGNELIGTEQQGNFPLRYQSLAVMFLLPHPHHTA